MATRIESLARWWNAASQEARFAKLRQAVAENEPPLQELKLAIILAEIEAGQVESG